MLKPSATDKIRISWDYDEADPWVITVWPGRSMQREPGYRLAVKDHGTSTPIVVRIYSPRGDWFADILRPVDGNRDATTTEAVGIAASIVEHWDG